MNKEQATKIISKHEPLFVAYAYNILFTNDVVCGLTVEALAVIEQSPLYKHRTKQLVKCAKEARHKYEKTINGIMNDNPEFFSDANEIVSNEISKHLDILYYTIKKQLDKQRTSHSATISKLELARTFCEFSCTQFDERIEKIHAIGNRFKKVKLSYMRLTQLSYYLNEIISSLHIPTGVVSEKECSMALNIITQKLGDANIIAKAISA